jgi:GNAT superfamily N-acetyltransferase
MVEIKDATPPGDIDDVARLWRDYLSWGNDEMEARHGFRLPVEEAVQHDVATIGKFEPPDGRLLLAFVDDRAIGTAAMRRIGPDTAEIKRMWVDPSERRGGIGRAMLDRLLEAASDARYSRIVLDSPDFMTDAHRLYRARGFTDREPYPETEIPPELHSHWVFTERRLSPYALAEYRRCLRWRVVDSGLRFRNVIGR